MSCGRLNGLNAKTEVANGSYEVEREKHEEAKFSNLFLNMMIATCATVLSSSVDD